MTRNLLLLSNSTNHGSGYLEHAIEEMKGILAGIGRILFVPFALADRTGYTAKFRQRMTESGWEVDELMADASGAQTVAQAEAVFVGGGNTFRLLRALRQGGLLAPLASRVRAGMPYLGASAGINVACPTICTTNDMPIIDPQGFDALGLVPFQINPHYVDPSPDSIHMGETREQRIVEFLEENDRPVVGLREGAWIRVEGERAWLGGRNGARLFRRGREPVEAESGAVLDALLAG